MVKAPEPMTVKMENARLIFRNFRGEASQFNAQGKRNFGVILTEDVAKQMERDGWNVKRLKPREGDEEEVPERTPWLPVEVGFKTRPPRIVFITSTSRTNLKEDQLEVLDWCEIKTADLIVRSYEWAIQATGKSGIKAYLQSLFVTIEEDELELKYQVNAVE